MSGGAVLIGWARVNRFEGEPLAAWAEALRRTGVDPAAIDSLDVVHCQSWPYDDPPGRLAESVGATPRRTHYSGIGGTTPFELLGRAAGRIAAGEADVCAVVGGEALATKRALRRAGERPQWSHRHPDPPPFPFEAPFHDSEVAHGVFRATTTFALRDVSRRAHLGTTVEDHERSIGELLAPMTEVAARNPAAWFPQRRRPGELVGASPGNRMVAYPYRKLTVAIMDVDQAAALVVASPAAADRLGIPVDQRVAVRGWAEARDPDYVAEHPDLWRAPGMGDALAGALAHAGVGIDDVAHLDLYSCFASSVTFSLDALGLTPDDARGPFTVTGGLPYAGGPGSGYGLASTAAMADVLVADPRSVGLVTGVGMHLSKHAAVVLSTTPGAHGERPGVAPAVRRPVLDEVDGPAVVAGYTVHHDRDGSATDALLVCDVGGDGAGGEGRCYARATDPGFLSALEAEEWVGRRVTLAPEAGVNVVR
ncbi:MAG: acetyl-CoA synthetase [Microthrixaceae bacterium]